MDNLDWSLARAFAAVAETGSLSAAARKLGQSQPTLGRQVRALEAQLGVDLFRRVPRGLEMTEAALDLLPHARAMAEAAAHLELAAQGRSQDLSGTVRITASVFVSHFLLPPILARLRRDCPEIQIELVASDAPENLIFREADIAIRMFRPEQLDIVARHIADQPTGLYAARAYLDRAGAPRDMADLMRFDFLGFDRNELIIRTMRQMGFDVSRDFFPVRCDDQAAYWHLLRAGCGVGGVQCAIADPDPLVARVLPNLALPPLPYWLAAPDALRQVPRLRRVWDFLAEALRDPRPLDAPTPPL